MKKSEANPSVSENHLKLFTCRTYVLEFYTKEYVNFMLTWI